MVSFPSPSSYKFNTFKGIRTRNGIASGGVISATECVNVDFVPSSYDAGVVIQTTKGNVKTLELTDSYADYTIIKGFEFDGEGTKYQIYYCEKEAEGNNNANGVLLKYTNGEFSILETKYTYYDPEEPLEEDRYKQETIDPDNWMSVTRKANSTTLYQAYNVFIFTNGIDYYAWCPDAEDNINKLRKIVPKVDIYDEGTGTLKETIYISGMAIASYNHAVVVGGTNGYVVASRGDNIMDFDRLNDDYQRAWFETFGKPITALVPYIEGLLVFTEDENTILSGMSSADTANRTDASLGGCMSFESWVKHDKYIFFYDNKQKNLYYYLQNDYGQKVLGEPIAPEVQKYFNNITRLQMISYIGNNRSEIWLLSNNFKLIYDYFIGEWTERQCQELTSYFVFDNNVYSTSANKVLKEKSGNIGIFDEEFYPSKYAMQLINLGSFSNMKEMEIQPLVSVTADFNNTFYIDCEIDGKKVKTKYVKAYNNGAVWADDTPKDENTPDNELWDEQVFPSEDDSVIQQIKGKFISNWYYLRFAFRTNARSDDFSITGFELKGITQETDTTGRK